MPGARRRRKFPVEFVRRSNIRIAPPQPLPHSCFLRAASLRPHRLCTCTLIPGRLPAASAFTTGGHAQLQELRVGVLLAARGARDPAALAAAPHLGAFLKPLRLARVTTPPRDWCDDDFQHMSPRAVRRVGPRGGFPA